MRVLLSKSRRQRSKSKYYSYLSYNSSPTGFSNISWLRSQGVRREIALTTLFRKVAFFIEEIRLS